MIGALQIRRISKPSDKVEPPEIEEDQKPYLRHMICHFGLGEELLGLPRVDSTRLLTEGPHRLALSQWCNNPTGFQLLYRYVREPHSFS